ncbi:MAG: hypothetical protein OEX00_06700, partial [Gammaproteobacteria bacterium]|nr:hypothetical protein [Gammaproteobacteria bacterium]
MAKLQYLMTGECPKCGKTLIRSIKCTHATCNCSNPHPVIELEPGLILPPRLYNYFKKIADREKIPLDSLVNMVSK